MKIKWKKLIIIILITFIVGSFFSFFLQNAIDNYKELVKPINIPSIVFPVVWSILYLLMGISYYIVTDNDSKDKNKVLFIYGAQLVINSLWSLIFFGFNAYLASSIWIILLIISVIIMILEFYKINKKAALLQIPYLVWIMFAAYLNIMIYILNK